VLVTLHAWTDWRLN